MFWESQYIIFIPTGTVIDTRVFLLISNIWTYLHTVYECVLMPKLGQKLQKNTLFLFSVCPGIPANFQRACKSTWPRTGSWRSRCCPWVGVTYGKGGLTFSLKRSSDWSAPGVAANLSVYGEELSTPLETVKPVRRALVNRYSTSI